MNRQEETARVQIRAEDGSIHTAIQTTTMVGFTTGGRTSYAKGSIGWRLSNGRGLNTDDDREFTDTDGRSYRLID